MTVDSARHTGWKWDIINGYLEVFVRGTRVAYFDDATSDLTLLTNGLTVDSGGITITAGGVTAGAGIAVTGTTAFTDDVTYSDYFYPANAVVETITADKTLDYLDSGKIMLCATDSIQFTLPAMTDSTCAGATFTIINIGTDDATEIAFSPSTGDQIVGPNIAGVDGKDLINTAATSKSGDMCRVVCDGVHGYFVTDIAGTWAAQG